MSVLPLAVSQSVRTLITVVAAISAVGLSAAPAAAADVTPFASSWTTAATTYRAVPAKGLIEVSINLKVTNHTQDTYETYPCIEYYDDPYWGLTPYSSTCSSTKRWYVDATSLFAEVGASNLRATSAAGKVKVQRGSTGPTDTISPYTLTFPRIYNGQTRTIKVSYVLRAGAARSGSGRVNPAYVSFAGFAQPVDSATVRMVLPAAFDTSTFGGTVAETRSGSSRVYASGPVHDTSTFYVVVTGTNLAGYHRESIQSPQGREIRIEAWPGDDGWLDAVREEATGSIGALEEAIGQPLPGSGPITVREVAGGSLGDAYAGAFDPDRGLAQIPESYQQPGTVAHELSHTWFNRSMFEAQWLSEGYAQWAERAVGANPEPCTLPSGIQTSRADVELADWKYASPRATQAEIDAVTAEYEASCGIVSKVATEIGPDRMRAVLAVLSTANGAYPGTHDDKTGAANDWRAWLDAVDEQGMVPAGLDATTEIADLLVRYGATTDGDLAGRADARTALGALRETAGTWWTIPSAVYAPFATWDFATASGAVDEVDATIRGSWNVVDVLPQLRGIDTPLKGRVAEATTQADLASVHETVDRQLATAHKVSDALDRAAASLGPVEALGLLGVDFGPIGDAAIEHVGSLDLDAAETDVAVIDATLHGATGAGLVRLGVGMGVVSALLSGAYLVLRRRRRLAPVVVAESVPADGIGTAERVLASAALGDLIKPLAGPIDAPFAPKPAGEPEATIRDMA
jgi:hypothetical protein